MFNSLIGNEPVKEIFKRLLKKRRVPNSLLFAGIDGVGKKQFAMQLAKGFLCSAPVESEACDRCPNCLKAVKFSFPKSDDRDSHKQVIFSEHPDLGLVIPYNRNILVDAIRDLEKEANFRPYQAGARFFIIDEADKMNDAASNALLKTLEEPPDTTYIFLITSRPDALLQTIHSRCQTVRFAPVPPVEIEKHLLEGGKFSPNDARILSNLSRGSIGSALESDPEEFRAARAGMLTVLESLLLTKNRASLLQTAEELSDARFKDSYETRLDILQTLIHDVWSLALGKPAEDLVNSDIAAELLRLSAPAESRKLASWLIEIETLRENLKVNLNRKIASDALFMRMAN
ncbi:MAG: DNA polymerase III subunit delta' [Pyrinomonadaceae bacterium]